MSQPVPVPIKVLVVDDHPLLRDGIIAHLREAPGISVVGQAGDGQAALQEAERLRPDFFVSHRRGPAGQADRAEAEHRYQDG